MPSNRRRRRIERRDELSPPGVPFRNRRESEFPTLGLSNAGLTHSELGVLPAELRGDGSFITADELRRHLAALRRPSFAERRVFEMLIQAALLRED
jgi:hypothetical protein